MNPPNQILLLIGDASARASLIILLLLALRPWLRRILGSRVVSLFWLVVLVRLLMPWSVESSWSLFHRWSKTSPVAEAASPWETTVTVRTGVGEHPVIPDAAPSAPPRASLRRAELFFMIWGAGALVAAMAFAARSFRTGRLLRCSVPADDPRLAAVFLAIPHELRGRATLRLTDEIPVAALVGIRRPRILLPREWAAVLSDDELRFVLLHELGHAHRGDLVVQWLFALAQSVHWFNPFVWFASRWARTDAELACDAWVLSRSAEGERQGYGATLLKASQLFRGHLPIAPLAVGMAASLHTLLARVRQVSAYSPVTRWRVWAGAALSVAVAALWMTSQTSAQGPVPARPTPTAIPPPAGGKPSPDTKAAADAPDQSFEIEAKFFELSEATAKKLGLVTISVNRGSVPNAVVGEPPIFGVVSVLYPQGCGQLLQALNKSKGVDLVTIPRMKMASGQRQIVEMTRDFRYPIAFAKDQATGKITPTDFETRKVGVTLEVEALAAPEGNIDVSLAPQIVEFEGFADAQGHPIPPSAGQDLGLNISVKDLARVKPPKDAIYQPILSTRKVTTSICISPDCSILLGGLKRMDEMGGKPPASRMIYALVTVRVRDRSRVP